MDKHMKKLIKYYQEADQCVSRKKAKKLLKKTEKAFNKYSAKNGDKHDQ